jgi:hypothetical protein
MPALVLLAAVPAAAVPDGRRLHVADGRLRDQRGREVTVLEHTFDDAASTLRLRYRAAGRAPLELFVPPPRFPNGARVTCDGAPVRLPRRTPSGLLTVRCGRGDGERLVRVEPAP